MKYILVKQEDFDKLNTNSIEDRSIVGKSIEDYRFGFDAKGLHFMYWDRTIDFFKENGIAYKVVER